MSSSEQQHISPISHLHLREEHAVKQVDGWMDHRASNQTSKQICLGLVLLNIPTCLAAKIRFTTTTTSDRMLCTHNGAVAFSTETFTGARNTPHFTRPNKCPQSLLRISPSVLHLANLYWQAHTHENEIYTTRNTSVFCLFCQIYHTMQWRVRTVDRNCK